MFEEVYGHERQKAILERQLQNDKLSHAYLFSGIEGIGKRKLAEDFAVEIIKSGLDDPRRKVSLNHSDIVRSGYSEDPINIAEIRRIIGIIKVSPLEGNNRVFLIDHADRMNPIAQNALLKTLEEPQPGNVFILITDNPERLLETIKSRCQSIPFKDVNVYDKKRILEGLGFEAGDLSLPVADIIGQAENPGLKRKNEELYRRFEEVMGGDHLEALRLAQDIAEEPDRAGETILFLIRKLYSELIHLKRDRTAILETLFDLYDKLAYNVNLRLQLESSLVKISMEHKNGKEYSRS